VISSPPSDSASIGDIEQIGPFDFRWPEGVEHFESGWTFQLIVEGETHGVRHGIGGREVYGRERVHTVTWLDGEVAVEGVEADDYPSSGCLLSLLRHPDKKMVRSLQDVHPAYDGFDVVDHRQEIEAKWSRSGLAVKIPEDNLLSWGVHAWLRKRLGGAPAIERPPRRPAPDVSFLPPSPSLDKEAVAAALLAHGATLAQVLRGGAARFAVDESANSMIHEDPFAFLVAVIADQGIKAERAWAIPYELQLRLGAFSPQAISDDPEALREAFSAPPKLHRFVNQVADWILAAAEIVDRDYSGDAAKIWAGTPSAKDLRARFDAFPGIGQKKAAMAVEILVRDLGVPVDDLSGSDVAYDIHLRRVFLRTGLAERDDVDHMVAVARSLHPDRPGELDNPTWDIGRRWCTAGKPSCQTCPLVAVCPRLIERGDAVQGI
jgi:uncharacterized HhH-GPD family protein